MSGAFQKSKLHFAAVSALVPMGVYVIWLILDSAIAAWKVGVESRPFVYIGTANVLVFLIYGLVACFLAWMNWSIRNSRFAKIVLGLSVGSFALYWIGLLTRSIGLLGSL